MALSILNSTANIDILGADSFDPDAGSDLCVFHGQGQVDQNVSSYATLTFGGTSAHFELGLVNSTPTGNPWAHLGVWPVGSDDSSGTLGGTLTGDTEAESGSGCAVSGVDQTDPENSSSDSDTHNSTTTPNFLVIDVPDGGGYFYCIIHDEQGAWTAPAGSPTLVGDVDIAFGPFAGEVACYVAAGLSADSTFDLRATHSVSGSGAHVGCAILPAAGGATSRLSGRMRRRFNRYYPLRTMIDPKPPSPAWARRRSGVLVPSRIAA